MMPDAVRRFQRAADLQHDFYRFLRRQLLLLLHQAAQVLTFDKLHGDELHAFGFAQVVDPDYVFVRDPSSQQQFLLEAVDDGLASGQLGPDDFQRHHAIQFAVARLVDRAHPTFAEDLQDFVTLAEHLAGLKHGLVARTLGLAGQVFVGAGQGVPPTMVGASGPKLDRGPPSWGVGRINCQTRRECSPAWANRRSHCSEAGGRSESASPRGEVSPKKSCRPLKACVSLPPFPRV